jgi:hypothetical protein
MAALMDNFDSLIGLTEEDAIEILKDEGWRVRITVRDGKYYIVTRDYRLDRVNLQIVDGKVNKIDVG